MMILPLLTWSRSAIFALVLATFLSWALPSSSFAARTNDPGTAQNASNFARNPSSLLGGRNGPLTTAQVSSAVRSSVAANPQALAAAIGVTKCGGLRADEQTAIGTALALAAGVCIGPDLAFAPEIQIQIAGTASDNAKQAYGAVTGLIAGGGAGGAGSTGSVGGPTNRTGTRPSGGSTALAFTSNSVSYTPANFFTRSAGGARFVGTTTTTSTIPTMVCVVSQTCA
jgi:hypothetical protein